MPQLLAISPKNGPANTVPGPQDLGGKPARYPSNPNTSSQFYIDISSQVGQVSQQMDSKLHFVNPSRCAIGITMTSSGESYYLPAGSTMYVTLRPEDTRCNLIVLTDTGGVGLSYLYVYYIDPNTALADTPVIMNADVIPQTRPISIPAVYNGFASGTFPNVTGSGVQLLTSFNYSAPFRGAYMFYLGSINFATNTPSVNGLATFILQPTTGGVATGSQILLHAVGFNGIMSYNFAPATPIPISVTVNSGQYNGCDGFNLGFRFPNLSSTTNGFWATIQWDIDLNNSTPPPFIGGSMNGATSDAIYRALNANLW